MTKGIKNAPKAETPKPLVEKIAEAEAGRGSALRSSPEKTEVEADGRENAGAADRSAQARPDRREAQEAGRAAEAGQGRSTKPLPPKKPAAASSRNSTPTRSRRCSTSAIRSARPRPGRTLNRTPSLGTATRQRRPALAIEIDALRARLMPAVESAGRHRRMPDEFVIRVRIQLEPRRHVWRAAAGADQRQRHAVSIARATAPCAPYSSGAALHHAAARALRHLEGHRDHLRSARHVPRLAHSQRQR